MGGVGGEEKSKDLVIQKQEEGPEFVGDGVLLETLANVGDEDIEDSGSKGLNNLLCYNKGTFIPKKNLNNIDILSYNQKWNFIHISQKR